MTKGVSRRNFVALAGAGLTLAACKQASNEETDVKLDSAITEQNKKDITALRKQNPNTKFLTNPDTNHGRLSILKPTTKLDANGNPVNGRPFSKKAFEPKHIAIVAIHWSDKGLRTSEHWFENALVSGGPAASDEESFVIKMIKAIRTDVPSAKEGSKYKKNFKDFEFGSQHKVYIYMTNEGYKFFKPLPISFNGRSGDVFGPDGFGVRRDENHSFFEANVLEGFVEGGGYNTDVLYVANWFMDKDGNPLDHDGKIQYSMRINTLHPTGDINKLKLVELDPDTGNGWGSTP